MSLPYRWLTALILAIALIMGGYYKGRVDNEAKHTKETLEATQEAQRTERKRAAFQQETLDAKDATIRRINDRLADALVRLRNRPERLPDASLASCKGSTGRELSGPDAAFLERFAARADTLRSELKACQDREHGNLTP